MSLEEVKKHYIYKCDRCGVIKKNDHGRLPKYWMRLECSGAGDRAPHWQRKNHLCENCAKAIETAIGIAMKAETLKENP